MFSVNGGEKPFSLVRNYHIEEGKHIVFIFSLVLDQKFKNFKQLCKHVLFISNSAVRIHSF